MPSRFKKVGKQSPQAQLMGCLEHCMLVQMGIQEKKMDLGSEKGRGEVLRMEMQDWKEGRLVGLHGVVDVHSDQL